MKSLKPIPSLRLPLVIEVNKGSVRKVASLEIRFARLQEAVKDHIQKIDYLLNILPTREGDRKISESVEDLRWAAEKSKQKESKNE